MPRTAPSQPDSATRMPLLRAIHAAGADGDAWPGVLERLRQHLDARVATLMHHAFDAGTHALLYESPGGFGSAMETHAGRSPWFLSSGEYWAGRVMTGDELIGSVDLQRTDFYRGVLHPRGLLHLLCGVIDQRERGAHVLAVYRARTQPAFNASDKEELAQLLDHVTLSMHSHWRWQEAQELAHALLRLSDHDASPVILVGPDAHPLHMNAAARQLLDAQRGLRLDQGQLVADHPRDRRQLAQTIAQVAHQDPALHGARPTVLTMAAPDGDAPVVVVVRPAGAVFRRSAGAARGLALVAVRGAHPGHDPAHCVFAHQYELTPAQAKVCALVFAGQSLAAIAQQLALSENTVRSHLKQIFLKTDTHGQMELVHLHARVCQTLP